MERSSLLSYASFGMYNPVLSAFLLGLGTFFVLGNVFAVGTSHFALSPLPCSVALRRGEGRGQIANAQRHD
jgi:hypothetical protein